MKRLIFALAAMVSLAGVSGTEAEQAARLKWFTDARFGMFIHFGAYSLAARHEWVKNYEIKVKIPLGVAGIPRTDVDPSFILPVIKPNFEIPVIEVMLK